MYSKNIIFVTFKKLSLASLAIMGLITGTSLQAKRRNKHAKHPMLSFEVLNLNTITPVEPSQIETKTIDEIAQLIKKKQKHDCVTQINDKYYSVRSGMPGSAEVQTVYLYSRGTTELILGNPKFKGGGGGFYLATGYLKYNVLTMNPSDKSALVTFDYPTDGRCLNFGDQDIAYLEFVYKRVRTEFPNAQIVLTGDCRGASAIINLLIFKKPSHIKAVIIESPSVSLHHIVRHLTSKNVKLPQTGEFKYKLMKLAKHLPFNYAIVNGVFKLYFKHYKPLKNHMLNVDLAHLPKDIPILIAAIDHDIVASHSDIIKIVGRLRQAGNSQVYFFSTSDPKTEHGKLAKNESFQQTVNTFLKKYEMAHKPEHAQKGDDLLSVSTSPDLKG